MILPYVTKLGCNPSFLLLTSACCVAAQSCDKKKPNTHIYICTKTNTVVNTDTKKRCNHSKIKMPTEDPALAHIDM
jgi:hypothetical protein